MTDLNRTLTFDLGYFYRRRARVYLKAGSADRAIADYTTAINVTELDAFGRASAYEERARAHLELGNHDRQGHL
jgi:hypothetical protein